MPTSIYRSDLVLSRVGHEPVMPESRLRKPHGWPVASGSHAVYLETDETIIEAQSCPESLENCLKHNSTVVLQVVIS